MTSKENKELVRHIFTEIGKGNHQPFLEAVAEDFTVTCSRYLCEVSQAVHHQVFTLQHQVFAVYQDLLVFFQWNCLQQPFLF